jgi:succinoglycan biosynthesis transport protein ExoP
VELRQYFALLRKWAWLIILTSAIAAGSSYFYSLRIPPTYRANTSMLVGQILQNPGQSALDVQSQGFLAQAYALLATQPPILQATAEAIKWPQPWQSLYFKVSANATGSQLLQISATDGDPQQAKAIADEVAHQLLLKGPISAQQQQAQDQQSFISAQLSQLKLQIETNQKTLTNLTNQLGLETDPKKIQDLNTRIGSLQSSIANWQSSYASLSAVLNTGQNLFMTELVSAQVPAEPVSPNIPQNVLLAAIAGVILSGAAVLLLEYLDDTIKDSDDVQRVLNFPTLGSIARIANTRQLPDSLITFKHPRSPIAEAYRVLRTNLRFSGIENPSGALLVTSAGPAEGKTTTASNLAVTLAQGGRRVILVDADLRRPSIHKVFGLPNEIGLSNLFLGDAPTLDSVLQPTTIEGLKVVTSGPLPPNPAEILDSMQMNEMMATLRSQTDMLILDSPPVLAVADASILGSRCSGAVLVIDSGHTRSDACRRAAETLGKTKVKILGAVLNKLTQRRAAGSYSYYYYSSQDRQVTGNGHSPN